MTKKKDTAKKSLVKLSPTLYADKDTYDKVHRHLSDINDTISEEDIENVSTDIVVANTHEAKTNDRSALKNYNGSKRNKDLSEKEEEKMYKEGEKINTPWNIMSE